MSELLKSLERQLDRTANSSLPSRFPVVTGLESAPEPKPAPSDTVRREIDRIARQLDGLTKSLKRVKDSL